MATDGRSNAIIETSALVNFLKIDRTDLLAATRPTASSSSMWFATRSRSTTRPRSRGSTPPFAAGQLLPDDPPETQRPRRTRGVRRDGRLKIGDGERAAIAAAKTRGLPLAMDDERAWKRADGVLLRDPERGTVSIMVSLIKAGVIDVAQADAIKADWEANHRYRLKLTSFSGNRLSGPLATPRRRPSSMTARAIRLRSTKSSGLCVEQTVPRGFPRARRSQATVPARRPPPAPAGFPAARTTSSGTAKLAQWAGLLWSPQADTLKEQEILPDFLTDVFCGMLGYTRAGRQQGPLHLLREKHVQVDGKFADAVLGDFGPAAKRFIVAVEGKGPKDPLDRPFAGRRMSAVDQGYRYAINLPCDWIIVTSIRQTRLYHKGTDQQTYERFDTEELAEDEAQLKRFVFLLGAARVVPAIGPAAISTSCWESEKVGRELTKEFYVRYADMRQDAFEQLCRDNPAVARRSVLASTQKLLDRVLFCAFCEDRGLLPAETIRKAYEHRDPYNPRPIWENFRGLFGAINGGNAALGIPAYNGGLFADDPVLERLERPRRGLRLLPRTGRIRLPARLTRPPTTPASGDQAHRRGHPRPHLRAVDHRPGKAPQRAGRPRPSGSDRAEHTSRRKKEGAFYTPAFITRYIVDQALGRRPRRPLRALRRQARREAKGTARRVLADPRVYDLDDAQQPRSGQRSIRVLGRLAGRARDASAARPGLRQRGLPDRGIRPALHRLPALERPAGRAPRASRRSSTSTSRFWRTTSTAST